MPNDPDNPLPPVGKPGESPLKALPVTPLETGSEDSGDHEVMDEQTEEAPPEQRRAIRAIPVGEDEVIEEGVEEP